MSKQLNVKNGFIFRIVHRANIPWMLMHGLHCQNAPISDPNNVNIGNADLIDRRRWRRVPVVPGGMLSNYVPFYFTPYTPMSLNIKTGRNGVVRRPHDEIVILVSSIHRLRESGIQFLFTDRHAYLSTANFYSDPADLDKIDWDILQRRDFQRDNEDLGKVERYQAEALVYKSMPVEALLGILCYNDAVRASLDKIIGGRGIDLRAVTRPGWYV
jgi:hypothetical protein